jgi:hypothetical protein
MNTKSKVVAGVVAGLAVAAYLTARRGLASSR